jgi:hypothetical protein
VTRRAFRPVLRARSPSPSQESVPPWAPGPAGPVAVRTSAAAGPALVPARAQASASRQPAGPPARSAPLLACRMTGSRQRPRVGTAGRAARRRAIASATGRGAEERGPEPAVPRMDRRAAQRAGTGAEPWTLLPGCPPAAAAARVHRAAGWCVPRSARSLGVVDCSPGTGVEPRCPLKLSRYRPGWCSRYRPPGYPSARMAHAICPSEQANRPFVGRGAARKVRIRA